MKSWWPARNGVEAAVALLGLLVLVGVLLFPPVTAVTLDLERRPFPPAGGGYVSSFDPFPSPSGSCAFYFDFPPEGARWSSPQLGLMTRVLPSHVAGNILAIEIAVVLLLTVAAVGLTRRICRRRRVESLGLE